MKLKISHPNPEVFQEILKDVLNISTVVALGGQIPSELEMNNPSQRGRYWWKDEDRYHLASSNNDWWAFIREEYQTSIVLEIRRRNDTKGAADALTLLLVALFRNDAEIV